MKRDTLFADTRRAPARFEFNEDVAEVFDDMVSRSVPFYAEQQRLLAGLAARYCGSGAVVCELGCSTGATLVTVAAAVGPSIRLVGYDNSAAMLDRARIRIRASGLADRIDVRCADLNDDPATLGLEHAQVILLPWTLQFVRPAKREPLVRRLFQALPAGGALVVAEKVRPDDPDQDQVWVDMYEAYKRANGYSQDEIDRKRRALTDVLVPYGIAEDIALFRQCGFPVVDLVFLAFGFAAFLCLKTAGD